MVDRILLDIQCIMVVLGVLHLLHQMMMKVIRKQAMRKVKRKVTAR